jgi:general secretion pathway protein D
MSYLRFSSIVFCVLSFSALAGSAFQADLEGATFFNSQLSQLKDQLRNTFDRARQLSETEATDIEYRSLLGEAKNIKDEIRALEEKWRKASIKESSGLDDAYALWDVGETTLAQLIMEYGASDYLYIIPQELSAMKLSLFSSIPLPRESWNEMIEMILSQNGVGVKKLNTFVKQLYILKLDPSAIEGIVSCIDELNLFSNHARIFYVFSPPPEQIKSVQGFFERFSDPKQTTIQAVGSKVVLVSTKETIEKLLGLYSAVWEKKQGKVVRLIPLSKIDAQEAEKVLKAVFVDGTNKARPNFYGSSWEELVMLTLPQGLVLVGESDAVDRGQRIINELESQLEDPAEKVIFWYTCKHSDPEDVAGVLEKVYDSLIGVSLDKKPEVPTPAVIPPPPVASPEPSIGQVFPDKSTAFNPVLPVNPPFVQPGIIEKKPKSNFGNFVVDAKTTSILMVIRREELSKIKSLLKKLDVPKKMVQIDVMLVEKKLQDRRQVGFNLLQFGANASGINQNSVNFNTESSVNIPIGRPGPNGIIDRMFPTNRGVLSYLFSRESSNNFPAVDLMFNFLLAQDDIRINANPSVLAINQTEATISILEEISINNGAIQLNTSGGVTIEQAYTRAQYGTTITLTPTIQVSDQEEREEVGHPGFVSLKSNITFDTTMMTVNDRPPVTRRHIENEVRIADGETVILGGLRRKTEEDVREKIPFLGDLPGIGKLFGSTRQNEINTEMFIFLTPHIVQDPVEDLRRVRQCEYMKRAGDIPEFLSKLDEAKAKERKKMFSNSLKTLFDMY